MKLLKKCEDKLTNELDIVYMLKQMRLSRNILQNLLSKDQKQKLKFQKTNILDPDNSSSSSSSSSDNKSEIKCYKKKVEVKQSYQFKTMIDQTLEKGLNKYTYDLD